ncbi:DUF433 domain-containing protein [Nocardia farcinica]|uniref:DUF433 domain-containing protein n=1 Tax=Nocardia farcinica TaxID=37329 RepID=UPI00378D9434
MTTDVAGDVRFTAGTLRLTDAARFLNLSKQTFHRWAKGYPGGRPLIHTVQAPPRKASIPFIGLTEAFVLEALRDAGVRVQKIRPALAELQRQFGHEHALVAPNLATDGIDVLWDFSKSEAGQGLIEGRSGQHVMREIVSDYLVYLNWDEDQLPNHLVLRQWLPSKVVVNPYSAFGQPRFGDSGPRVADVAAMLKSEESTDAVVDEFGISAEDVRTAARILLGRAA